MCEKYNRRLLVTYIKKYNYKMEKPKKKVNYILYSLKLHHIHTHTNTLITNTYTMILKSPQNTH